MVRTAHKPAGNDLGKIVRRFRPSPKCVLTIPPTIPFLDALAEAIGADYCPFPGRRGGMPDGKAQILMDFQQNIKRRPTLVFPPQFAQSVLTCGRRLNVFNLTMANLSGMLGHANTIVVDKKRRTIERFEPHGELEGYGQKFVDPLMRSRLASLLPGYTYIPPSDFQDKHGPQGDTSGQCPSGGLCQAWCVAYAEMRLRNPSLAAAEVVKRLVTLSRQPQFIERYIEYFFDGLRTNAKGFSRAT